MSSILITGVTGTFGRAFLKSCVSHNSFKRVIGFSRDELKQSQLAEEYAAFPALRLFLGDVRSAERLQIAMYGVDTVIHAAALKRVDAAAYSPSEIILTNIIGTMNVVGAAIAAGVKKVVVISSDKAVQATNIYGATKFCSETYAVQANAYGAPRGTTISAVRYGNILGSRGSVVHVWREQAARGEPLTLTDENMTRFIMTIEQAVELVWFARQEMFGGEVFVPILPSARMVDLAQAVVPGHNAIRVTGLRPGGEKMAEALLNDEEASRTYVTTSVTGTPYFVVTPSHHDWTAGDHWAKAAGDQWLKPGFRYSSDGPEQQFLDSDELAALMRRTEACR